MITLKAIQNLISKSSSSINHLLVSLNKTPEIKTSIIHELITYQSSNDIPVLSIDLSNLDDSQVQKILEFVNENIGVQTRVSILGQWYNSDFVDIAKKMINSTEAFDQNFLNLLVKYDGQVEILSSIKVLIKKIALKKISLKELNLENVKESIYSSYFITPDVIIQTGKPRFSGSFLWDSKSSCIYFTKKSWLEFSIADINKAKEFYEL